MSVMSPSVYLAGPITGIGYDGATAWREDFTARLKEEGIAAFSPMRGKRYLKDVKEFTMDGDAYKNLSVLSSNRGIMTRDRWDAARHDALVANVLGAEKPSLGTVMEIAWADAARIPIILVIEPQGNPHDHGMLLEATGFRVPDLDTAFTVLKGLLLP